MSFVQGKCENCGAFLPDNPSLKSANCPYCGTAYVIQDSTNYYNQVNQIEHLNADAL